MKFLLVIQNNEQSSLENSYLRAIESSGHLVDRFMLNKAIENNLPLTKLPKFIQNFVFGHFETQSTIRKINVELTKYVLKNRPDVILCFTNSPINPSTIVYLRSIGIKVALIYPDAIINMALNNSSSIPCFDAIFSYSKQGIEAFKLLGAKNIYWCPLAGDDNVHRIAPNENIQFDYDISFIGNYRPEREEVLEFVIQEFPFLKIRINGSWKSAKSKLIKSVVENQHLFGKDYANFINRSLINLNIIDYSNYPAANMRFFEIPMAGGLQISSECPEMQDTFQEGKHLFYYNNLSELAKKIKYCIENKQLLHLVRATSHQFILNEHLYSNRILVILKALESID